MIEYIFCDTNDMGDVDYDIGGAAYQDLLDMCMKYSSIVSFQVHPNLLNSLCSIQLYRIAAPVDAQKHRSKYALIEDNAGVHKVPYEVQYYLLCPEVEKILRTAVDSLFSWIYGWGFSNLEDPFFYREDGSIFLSCVTHEGICKLFPKQNEDVSRIVSSDLWRIVPNGS